MSGSYRPDVSRLLARFSVTVILVAAILYSYSCQPVYEPVPLRRYLDRDCSTVLSNDLYGLGVRLGVYFQWSSGWVSNNFLVDSINSGLDANAIFLFALLVAIVSSTRTNAMTLMDGLIMIWLCAGTVWSVLSLWGYRTCIYRKKGLNGISNFGGFGTHLRLLLTGSVPIYGAWYWIFGVKGGEHGLEPFGEVDSSCVKTTVTVFKQDVAGLSGNAALALSMIAGVYAIVVILITPIAAVTRIRKMIIFWKTNQYGTSTRLRYATGASRKQLIVASRILGTINLLWIIFCIPAIEITLNENYAVGVLGANPQSGKNILQPGQLLPLLIGSFSFVQTLFNVFELWRYPISADITPSLGRAASKRFVGPTQRSRRGLNLFRLFSEGNPSNEHQDTDVGVSADEDEANLYLDLYLRLNVFQRIIITIFPHLSLFCFWPWNKTAPHAVLQEDIEDSDRIYLNNFETIPASGKIRRTRFADQDDESLRSTNITVDHSPIRYDPQQVRSNV